MELLTKFVDFNFGSSVNVNGIRNGSDECCLFNHCASRIRFHWSTDSQPESLSVGRREGTISVVDGRRNLQIKKHWTKTAHRAHMTH